MLQLGVVQFFSWIALFGMWVYTTPAVAQHIYGTADATSPLYQQAGDWVGVIFGVYNFVAMLFALCLIPISKKLGRKTTHAIALVIGGLSLISMYFITNDQMLILPMIGIGIAWASILAMPTLYWHQHCQQAKQVYIWVYSTSLSQYHRLSMHCSVVWY